MESLIVTVDEASLTSGNDFIQLAAQVTRRTHGIEQVAPVVVVPALAGMNQLLYEMVRHAFAGRANACESAKTAFYKAHQQVYAYLAPSEKKEVLCQHMEMVFCELDQELTAFPREADQRMLDASARIASCGERLSVLLMAYAIGLCERETLPIFEPLLIAEPTYSLAVSEPEAPPAFPHFSSRWGNDVALLFGKTRTFIQHILLPLVEQSIIPVVASSLGQTRDGAITMLARADSAHSETCGAALIAEALSASQVELWTATDGLLASDPSLCPNPPSIPFLSYEEALHLTALGGVFFHSTMLHLLAQQHIPLYIRLLYAPDDPGTLVGNSPGNRGQAKMFLVRRNLTMATLRRTSAGVMAEGALGDVLRSLDSFARQSLVFLHATPASLKFLGETSRMKVVPRLVAQWYGWTSEIRGDLALCACIGAGFHKDAFALSYALLTLAEAGVPVITAEQTDDGIFLIVEDQYGERALRSLYCNLLDPPLLWDHALPEETYAQERVGQR